ncbi:MULTISPECIES: spermidine synthase [unclassified Streptomyces]|uniref:spermidine synthase n=1 Tax=unclassified Streptomyces TaxID=2593676 RepID=UPI0022B63254|nr:MULTISPECIES: fused MFS/spermidine synthase [unclassified Streptomyces]MCZ7414427.1 fused MFS/spermidine synthase [Streptomyces sp. WMMC897]MCZ7431383.1 fused MFS/spermidine synthase [Streptomyces sp. WMMC1477]
MGRRAGQRRRGGRETVSARVGGGLARLVPEPDRPRGWTLTLDDAPQSCVDLDDPTYLGFSYQRRLGHALDVALAAAPGRPVRAVHLGGGACTLARYVAATRPRSTQQVIEVDTELTAFVRERLPWDAGWRIRVRGADARAGLARIPDGWADVVIADVFTGARTPAHLGTVEFQTEVRRVLASDGLYAANVTDGASLAYLRGQLATALAAFPEACVTADPAVLRGSRFGNAVLLAADRPLPVAELTRRAAGDPHPGRLQHGRELAAFTGGARPVTDAEARPSPSPPPDVFPGR